MPSLQGSHLLVVALGGGPGWKEIAVWEGFTRNAGQAMVRHYVWFSDVCIRQGRETEMTTVRPLGEGALTAVLEYSSHVSAWQPMASALDGLCISFDLCIGGDMGIMTFDVWGTMVVWLWAAVSG